MDEKFQGSSCCKRVEMYIKGSLCEFQVFRV